MSKLHNTIFLNMIIELKSLSKISKSFSLKRDSQILVLQRLFWRFKTQRWIFIYKNRKSNRTAQLFFIHSHTDLLGFHETCFFSSNYGDTFLNWLRSWLNFVFTDDVHHNYWFSIFASTLIVIFFIMTY